MQAFIKIKVFANGERLKPVQLVEGFSGHKNCLITIGQLEGPRSEIGQVRNETQGFLRRNDSKAERAADPGTLAHGGFHLTITGPVENGVRMQKQEQFSGSFTGPGIHLAGPAGRASDPVDRIPLGDFPGVVTATAIGNDDFLRLQKEQVVQCPGEAGSFI